jgi:hypothetical protein
MERQLSQVTIADVLDAVHGDQIFCESGADANLTAVVLTPTSISQ